MPPYTHLFHLTFLFLLFVNVSHLIITCNGRKVVFVKNPTKLEHSKHQFTKWVELVGSRRSSNHQSSRFKYSNENKAVVMMTASRTITVDQNPAYGNFRTIQAAIDSIPTVNNERVVINVHAGIYTEKVIIPATKSYITIQGAGAQNTIVQWNDNAKSSNGTFNSATFAVFSQFFIAKNITFKNTAPVAAPGVDGMQAVALRISADAAAFVGCKFLGAQDTLLDQMGRHYYKDCFIQGSVDFIFGDGRSLFENCELHTIAPGGALTAHHRNTSSDDSGFSFVNCKVTGSAAVFLGRAWGPFSRVVFAYTYMDNIILPAGWSDLNKTSRDTTVFFGQYACTGPGANLARRVKWSKALTDQEAAPFISQGFIDASQWLNLS